MADHRRISEEIITYLKTSENISKSLSEMKQSARTDKEEETVNRMWIQYMDHVMSETEERIRMDSVSSETGSNDVLVYDEKVTKPVIDQDSMVRFPIYDKEGSRCGTYEFLRKGDGKAKCSEEPCRNLKSVSLQTLKCHALKKHNIRLDVKKRKAVISEAIKCNVCDDKFTRKQTLASHQQKYHKSPVPTSLSLPVLSIPEDGSQQSVGEKNLLFFSDSEDINLQDVLGYNL